ncbi:MAG: ABC transporter ATP-binding protein [Pseudomonadota bacterium]
MDERVPIIRFVHIVKRFAGGVTAVDQVDLDIADGEFFSLLGPSGCGKTTLLRMLAGFESPSSGQILLDGKDITDLPPNRRPVNMVFQSYAVFPHMSVDQNVGYGLKVDGVSSKDVAARVSEALAMVRLSPMAKRRPDELSGGQRQRVALARALIKRPRVLLLDEPLSALDKKLRAEMQFELVRLRNEVGITFIMVTHDQEEAMSVSSRIGVMDGGKIVQLGSPQEIYERPVNRFVADFIGSINLLDGTLQHGETKGPAVRCPDLGADIPVDDAGRLEIGSEVSVGVRPEKVRLSPDIDDGRGGLNGTVVETAYLGERSIHHVKVGDGTVIQASAPNDAAAGYGAFTVGSKVSLSWPAGAAILLNRK